MSDEGAKPKRLASHYAHKKKKVAESVKKAKDKLASEQLYCAVPYCDTYLVPEQCTSLCDDVRHILCKVCAAKIAPDRRCPLCREEATESDISARETVSQKLSTVSSTLNAAGKKAVKFYCKTTAKVQEQELSELFSQRATIQQDVISFHEVRLSYIADIGERLLYCQQHNIEPGSHLWMQFIPSDAAATAAGPSAAAGEPVAAVELAAAAEPAAEATAAATAARVAELVAELATAPRAVYVAVAEQQLRRYGIRLPPPPHRRL
jgi:hypothetical protein